MIIRFVICNITLTFLCFNVIHSQSVRDSIDALIDSQKNITDKISIIYKTIGSSTFKTKKDLDNYYFRGLKYANQVNDYNYGMKLRISYADRMALIGENETANKCYNDILKIASKQKDTFAISSAYLGQSKLFTYGGSIEKAKDKLYEAIRLLKNNGHISLLVTAYNQLSYILRDEGNYANAQFLLDSVICLIKKDSTSRPLFSAYVSKGRIYRFQGLNDSAKIVYKTALAIATKTGDQLSLAVINNNLGNIEHVEGKYDNALKYYLKSLSIKEKIGDQRGTSVAYHNIGAILMEMKDWKKALDYLERSNISAKEIDFKSIVVHNNNKIGEVLTHDSLFNEAISYHQRALNISREINLKSGELDALYNLGKDYILLNDLNTCYKYLIEGLRLARQNKSKALEGSILVTLAESYLKSKEHNLDDKYIESQNISQYDIHKYLLDANKMADETHNAKNKLLALQGLDLYYSKTKNLNANIRILREYNTLKDSLFTEDRMKTLADWETKYETAEKEKAIIQLENEKKYTALKTRQFKYIVLGTAMLLIILGLFIFYYFRQRNKKQAALRREEFRTKLSSDLHDDVGSTLTGLAMQSELLSDFVDENLKKNLDNIARLSREAMVRMRDTVWAIDSRKDKISDLIDRMQDFAQTNLGSKGIIFKLEHATDQLGEKIDPEIRQNIYLIFKECIANILKHSNANQVSSTFKIENRKIYLTICDNGTVNTCKVKSSGLGVRSIKDRASNMKGTVNISLEKGCKVELIIPRKLKHRKKD